MDGQTELLLNRDHRCSVEGLICRNDAFEWVRTGPGAIFHVPTDAKHAWRNLGQTPAEMIIVSTSRMGRFFQELGTPDVPGAPPARPSEAEIQRFSERGRQIWLLEREAGGKHQGRDSSLKVRP